MTDYERELAHFLATHDFSADCAPAPGDVPGWAKAGRAAYARFDGGALEVAKAFLSGWEHMRVPDSVSACADWYGPRGFEVIERAGLNWLWVTWSVGFSEDDERLQRDELRGFLADCAARGVRVTAYSSLANMFIESMLRDVPASSDWVQLDPSGARRPYGAAEYVGEPTRILACLTNPAWLEYSKRRIRGAIEGGVVGLDYDNLFHGCACARCRRVFAEYTLLRYGAAWPVPGTVGLTAGDPDDVGMEMADPLPPEDLLTRVFRDFNYRVTAHLLTRLREYAQSLRPGVLIYCNAHQAPHLNEACNAVTTEDGCEPAIWREGSRVPGPYADGDPATNLPLFKYLLAEGRGAKPVRVEAGRRHDRTRNDGPMDPRTTRRAIYEAASCSCVHEAYFEGMWATQLRRGDESAWASVDAMGAANGFLAAHADIFADLSPASRVGFFVDRFDSGLYVPLVAAGVSFVIELARDISAESLRRYGVVVLPDVRALSDESCSAARSYVEGGGSLIASGLTSAWDERLLARGRAALADVFGVEPSSEPGPRLARPCGAGRVAYYPGDLTEALAARGEVLESFLADIDGALSPSGPLVRVSDPRRVVFNAAVSPTGGRLVLLVNMDDEPATGLSVSLGGEFARSGAARLVTDDGGESVLDVPRPGPEGRTHVTLPPFDLLAVLLLPM